MPPYDSVAAKGGGLVPNYKLPENHLAKITDQLIVDSNILTDDSSGNNNIILKDSNGTTLFHIDTSTTRARLYEETVTSTEHGLFISTTDGKTRVSVNKSTPTSALDVAGTVTATQFIGNVTGTATQASNLNNLDTDDLVEGTNRLYYTTARFIADFSNMTTANLTESTNLYYTLERFNNDLSNSSTDDLAEGSNNLYYTTARFDTRLATKTSDDITEGSNNKFYATSLFTNDLSNITTDNVNEGSNNLYYTTSRFNTAFSV